MAWIKHKRMRGRPEGVTAELAERQTGTPQAKQGKGKKARRPKE